MRDYAKVTGAFWTGKTGRALRGDPQAQVVALYLLTTKHANMIGVYHCPLIYIAHETGSPIEGASKALRRLAELDFCTFDEETEMVWVHEMARFQIAESLEPKDKQVKWIQKQYESLPESQIRSGFYRRYQAAFHLLDPAISASPFEAPSKPLRSQEQEQEQEQEQKQKPSPASAGPMRGACAPPDDFAHFWAGWPKKAGKQEAVKAWAKLKPDEATLSAILAAVARIAADPKQQADAWQFLPEPARWLRGRRWEDAPSPAATAYTDAEMAVMTAYAKTLANRGWPGAEATPFSPDRAAAIREFLGFGTRPGWVEAYFAWLAEKLPPLEGMGFDWVLRKGTFLRAKEGNFSALREAA